MCRVGGDEAWLAPLFLGELGPACRDQLHAAGVDVEHILARHVEAARAAWPALDLPAEDFVRHIAAVVDGPDESPDAALADLRAADLYLACACARGVTAALRELERSFIATLDAPLRSTGLDTTAVDEVRQLVREILLVGDDGVPGIARYAGRGQLRSWVRSVAVRQAARRFRGRTEIPVDADALDGLPDLAGDAVLAHWKQRYAAEFRVAFDEAVAALDERERNLLRQHHIDGLTVDALSALYRVHRATAARWVGAARAALLAGIRVRLLQRLKVSEPELDSILRQVRSQIDVSLRLMRPPPR